MAQHACGVPPAANYPMYAGLLSALDAGKPEPLLNELMRFGFVRETMNMTQPLDTSLTVFGCVDAADASARLELLSDVRQHSASPLGHALSVKTSGTLPTLVWLRHQHPLRNEQRAAHRREQPEVHRRELRALLRVDRRRRAGRAAHVDVRPVHAFEPAAQ